MDSQLNNNTEFEQFLKDGVKHHQMFASDGVWSGIYEQLHQHRRWPGLMIVAVFIVALLTLGTLLNPYHVDSAATSLSKEQNLVASTKTELEISQEQDLQNLAYFNTTQAAEATTSDLIKAVQKELINATAVTTIPIPDVELPNEIENNSVKETSALIAKNTESIIAKQPIISSVKEVDQLEISLNNLPAKSPENVTPVDSSEKDAFINQEFKNEINNKNIISSTNPVDDYINQMGYESKDFSGGKKSKWSYQVYITPSLSFRKLSDESIKSTHQSIPLAISNSNTDVNKVSRYRPGNSLEAGFSALYNLKPNLRLKLGAQFNIRQYNLDAYLGNTELTSITLLNGNNSMDTINTYAFYRSENGNIPTILINKYYSVAFPLGVEWDVLQKNRFGITVGASVQPTYSFVDKNAFILSSDYKNYTDGNKLFRNWNLNTSLEMTLNYKVGDYNWFLGPQIRYQHLPTFLKQYPIREHLLDFGIKVGFRKSIF